MKWWLGVCWIRVVGALLILASFGVGATDVCDSANKENLVLLKVGGSSVTEKDKHETVNQTALDWFAHTLAFSINSESRHVKNETCGNVEGTRRGYKFVVLHGAGSFGHFQAKQHGLTGQETSPAAIENNDNSTVLQTNPNATKLKGMAKTRLSVQSLNHKVVSALIQHGVNAVGISPCLGIPTLQAHGGPPEALRHLNTVLHDVLSAGLVPVLHGDACLYGTNDFGILGGDTLMVSILKAMTDKANLQNPQLEEIRAIFLTDVDGVYTSDPRKDPTAALLREIEIDGETEQIMANITASESTHAHDVTGGLKGKLGAAATMALMGTEVQILKCGSISAEQAIIHGARSVDRGSVIRRRSNIRLDKDQQV